MPVTFTLKKYLIRTPENAIPKIRKRGKVVCGEGDVTHLRDQYSSYKEIGHCSKDHCISNI